MSWIRRLIQTRQRARAWNRLDGVRRAGQLVLGIGTGRCGSSSLASLLAAQPGCRATHEEYPVLRWQGDEALAVEKVRRMLSRDVPVVADVAWYYLPYVEQILEQEPGAKIIVLERSRAEVIDSFRRKLPPGVNHWTTSSRRRIHRLDGSFPQYGEVSLEEGVGRYWDEYASRVVDLARSYPGQVRVWPTRDALNDPAAAAEVLRFAGFEHPDLGGVGRRLNAA